MKSWVAWAAATCPPESTALEAMVLCYPILQCCYTVWRQDEEKVKMKKKSQSQTERRGSQLGGKLSRLNPTQWQIGNNTAVTSIQLHTIHACRCHIYSNTLFIQFSLPLSCSWLAGWPPFLPSANLDHFALPSLSQRRFCLCLWLLRLFRHPRRNIYKSRDSSIHSTQPISQSAMSVSLLRMQHSTAQHPSVCYFDERIVAEM